MFFHSGTCVKSTYGTCDDGYCEEHSSCSECPAGTATDEYGAAKCSDCTPGYYQQDTGQTQAHL